MKNKHSFFVVLLLTAQYLHAQNSPRTIIDFNNNWKKWNPSPIQDTKFGLDAPAGQTYTFTVRAIGSDGLESASSNEASVSSK